MTARTFKLVVFIDADELFSAGEVALVVEGAIKDSLETIRRKVPIGAALVGPLRTVIPADKEP